MHIGVKNILPFRIKHILQETVPTDAGTVDQHLHRSPALTQGIKRHLHLSSLPNVTLYPHHITAFRLQEATQTVCRFNAFLIQKADAVPITSQAPHCGSADAAGTASNENICHLLRSPFFKRDLL